MASPACRDLCASYREMSGSETRECRTSSGLVLGVVEKSLIFQNFYFVFNLKSYCTFIFSQLSLFAIFSFNLDFNNFYILFHTTIFLLFVLLFYSCKIYDTFSLRFHFALVLCQKVHVLFACKMSCAVIN